MRSAEAGGVGDFTSLALAATRAAALACADWVGRGQPKDADAAATDAMREVLASGSGRGTVVVGEGAKDEAPMLYDGESLGQGEREFDIAVDPLECTHLCAKGLEGALTTLAISDRGAMADLGASFYMDKLVAGRAARGALDIAAEPEENLARLSEALDKPVEALRVVVLDKPRHEDLVGRLHAAGARVISLPDGDVAGALAALLPGGDADLLMGVGGTPEGVMTACATSALGGCMQARLAPQSEDESQALSAAGLDIERVLEVDDLVRGESVFVATGVTGGPLLRQPWDADGETWTESMVVSAGGVQRVVEVCS
ncbi:MAG: class II fructose-bisphosphatase [Actinomycetota bacterium]|nr:class II fructose-bisphosphatase [Actinomycetota bacterium]